MFKIIYFTLFIIQWERLYCDSSNATTRLKEDEFVVKHCLTQDVATVNPWPQRFQFEMTAYSNTYPIITTTWIFYKLGNNGETVFKCKTNPPCARGNNFVIEAFSLAGEYKIIALMNVHGVYKKRKECFLNIRADKPFAIIAGGSMVKKRNGEDIVVDGSQSIDYGSPKGLNLLKYRWTCRQNRKNGFCKDNVGTNKTFIIPRRFSEDGERIMVTMVVTSANALFSGTYQYIHIGRDYSHFVIKCIVNCPPLLKVTQDITFEVTCEKYCPKKCENLWYQSRVARRVSARQTDCQGLTKCSTDVFPYGRIQFGCDSSNGMESVVETYIPSISVKDIKCRLHPQTGTSYITTFSFNCQSTGYVDHFDVYVRDKNLKDEFLISWVPPFKKKFRLKPNAKKVVVRIFQYGGYSETLVDVNIKSFLKDQNVDSLNAQIANLYFGESNDSIRSTLKDSVNIGNAISKINSFWDNLDSVKEAVTSDKDFKRFIQNMKLIVLRDLTRIPIETYEALSAVSSTVDKILSYQTPDKSDPLLARDVSILCKKIAYFQVDFLKKDAVPEEVAEQTKIISDTLIECVNKNANANYDIMKPLPALPAFDEKQYDEVPFEDTIKEDYHNYVDYANNYYENMENFEEASSNMIKTAFLSGTAIGQTIDPNTTKFIANKADVGHLVHRYCKSKYKPEHKVTGVRVIPSEDVLKNENIYLSLMAWRKNLFWWSRSEVKPITCVAEISFVDTVNGVTVRKFKNPHTIIFDIIRPSNQNATKITQNVTVPSSYRDEAEHEDYMDPYINIHRINLFEHQALLVEFSSIKEGEQFNVVVKNFETPIIGDFKNNVTVDVFDKKHPFKSYGNDNKYGAWFYVAILPDRKMLNHVRNESATFSYTVSFAASVCYRWNFVEGWARSCKGGGSTYKDKISCECDRLSPIAADIEPVKEKFLRHDNREFETTLQISYLIFSVILAMIFLFYAFNLFEEKKKGIYYAADNLYENRYAYLLMVRTGKFRVTTAKVVIKVKGDQLESKPHVLNYPDPDHKILQRGNEDWIVVTTSGCLGDLTNIELWHDSAGIKPSWYCKDIVILDMQTRIEWFFKINRSLSVRHKHCIEVSPERVVRSKLKKAWQSLSLSTERHSWNLFEDDVHRTTTYFSRLLLVYSKLMALLVIVVFFYGLPHLQPMDGYDRYDEYSLDGYIFTTATVASLISCIGHAAVFWETKKYITYFTLHSIIISNTILIIFGFWIPYYTGLRIITAWFVGALVDILLYENILRIVKKIIFGTNKIVSVREKNISRVQNEIEEQREFLNEKYGDLLVQKIQNMPLHEPLRRRRAKARRLRVTRRRVLGQQINDLIMFGIYFILLYFVVLTDRDPMVFRSRDIITDLVEGFLTRTDHFSQIQSIPDIYNYINNTLIEGMQLTHWYSAFHLEDPGILADFNNKYIGVARLRQHRIKKDSCGVPKLTFIRENFSCYPIFNSVHEERRSFEDNWNNPTNYVKFHKRLYTMWVYSLAESTGSLYYTGRILKISNNDDDLDHIFLVHFKESLERIRVADTWWVPLGRNKYNSLENLYMMKNSTWIDRCTRSVFIEFLTYNANYNMFNSVLLVIERGATGWITDRIEVSPARMIFVRKEIEASLAIFIVFVVWVGILSVNRTAFIWNEGIISLKHFWNILDVIIILLSIVAIAIFGIRSENIRELLETLEHVKHNEFVNYFHLFHTHNTLTIIGAILVCASTIRLWKLLRFFKSFLVFEKTLVIAVPLVSGLLVYHAIITFLFTWVTHLLFAERSDDFLTMKKSLDSIINIFLRYLRGYEYNVFQSIGYFILIVYASCTYTIFQFYIVILMGAYRDAQIFYSKYHDPYLICHYIKDEFMFIFQTYKRKARRLRGGDEIRKTIWPKANEFLHANCVTTTTYNMNSMGFVAVVVVRNIIEAEERGNVLTPYEFKLMLRVCHHFLIDRTRGDTIEIFYKTHFVGQKFHIVDARRIDRARRAVEIILRDPEKVEEKKKYDHNAILDSNVKKLEQIQKKLDDCLNALKNIKID